MALLRPRAAPQATPAPAQPVAGAVGRYNPLQPPPLGVQAPTAPALLRAYPLLGRYKVVGEEVKPPPAFYVSPTGAWVRWADVEPLLARLAQLEGKE